MFVIRRSCFSVSVKINLSFLSKVSERLCSMPESLATYKEGKFLYCPVWVLFLSPLHINSPVAQFLFCFLIYCNIWRLWHRHKMFNCTFSSSLRCSPGVWVEWRWEKGRRLILRPHPRPLDSPDPTPAASAGVAAASVSGKKMQSCTNETIPCKHCAILY